MDPKVRRSWEELLNPAVMRPRLIAASLYIAGFEMLKDFIVNRILNFFKSGDEIGPNYQSDVLARNRSDVYASLDWLKELNAIDEHDLETFNRVKVCRNTLAHKLFAALGSEGLPADFERCFTEMVALFRKIEVWWIMNVLIPTNPDYNGSDIDESEIVPGCTWGMQMFVDIALGDDERSRLYYDEFRKRARDG